MGVVRTTQPGTDITQQLIMGWLKSLTLVIALTGVLCQDDDEEKLNELYTSNCINRRCLVPNSCKLSTDELKGEEVIMHTCVRCPNKYPWLDDPTGDGIILTGN